MSLRTCFSPTRKATCGSFPSLNRWETEAWKRPTPALSDTAGQSPQTLAAVQKGGDCSAGPCGLEFSGRWEAALLEKVTP